MFSFAREVPSCPDVPRSSFAHALQQLLLGDAAMQILAAPNEEVQRALELLQNDWNALEAGA